MYLLATITDGKPVGPAIGDTFVSPDGHRYVVTERVWTVALNNVFTVNIFGEPK
jgi:hypothetical protein